MPIRIKILLILLLTTIPPILFLRYNSMQSMNTLAEKVETRTEKILLTNINTSLLRIVEDHARLLKRERQLIDAALDILVNDTTQVLETSTPPTPRIPAEAEELTPTEGETYYKTSAENNGMCMSSPSVKTKESLRLLIPTVQDFANRYPDLILWQQVRLTDSSQMFFPTRRAEATKQQCLFGELSPPSTSRGAHWSQLMHDPLYDNSIFTASQNIYKNDVRIGTVTIAVPVGVLLRDPGHLASLSPNVTSYLVYINSEDGELVTVATRIPGEKEGKWFASPEKDINLDKEAATEVTSNILLGTPNLMSTSIDGVEKIVAYAPLGIGGTALMISVPRIDIVQDATKETDVIREIFTRQMNTSHLLLSATVLLLGCMAVILSISLSKSIHKLVQAVREVSAGNFSIRVPNVGKDEIGELGKAINEMVPSLEENVQIKSSLQLASEVQRSLLPKEIPSPPRYDLAGASYYCAETGGDYFDFISCASGSASHLVMAVGDVVGHGIPAALLMATARAYLRSCANNDFNLSEITRKTNELVVCDTYGTGQFMTLFLASLDTFTNTLSWTRAGHDSAMVYRRSESTFIEFKGIGSTALGVTYASRYQENIERLRAGDIVVIATDGIWEARSPEGNMFGKELMKTVIRNNANLSSKKLIEKLYVTALEFTRTTELEDDFTCIVIKYEGKN
ncbi:SpoIIE family protein phosphatase [Halodesulfovibrio sp.]|uniref:SpoIIE family protein phosphatase n=1 Tax=Halodesulfovibrio sp. TaxID=1912772 RepID=UPI0025BDC633|nr:SpoIIE family protein phosphatase [Halodesulfovibrio sp.]